MSQPFLNVVVDLSHHNGSVNFKKAAEGGIRAVIHKSTHGMTGRDETHDDRRKEASKAGLLWGSYHFGTGVASGAEQAEQFLGKTKPKQGDLLALDFEPNVDGAGHPIGPDMTLGQAREFVQAVQEATGWYPVLYGGHHLKEMLGDHNDAVLAQCPLWLAQYTKHNALPTWPKAWGSWTLWQYTGDGVGGEPHTAPGIGGVCERDYFIGTLEQLEESWKWNLNHADIGMLPPNATGLFHAPSPMAHAAAEHAQGWAAAFSMELKDSDDLLLGTLRLKGPDGASYEWVATSGRNPWQSEDDFWKKNKGPVPPNPDAASGNYIETKGYHGSVVPYSHRILPEAVTDPVSKITRDAFRVHVDGGNNGSAGCIALEKAADFATFDKLMLELDSHGVKKIPLRLIYT